MPKGTLSSLALVLVALAPCLAAANDQHQPEWDLRGTPSIYSADANASLTQVFITGSHFGARQGSVLFGGSKATVASWAPSMVVIDLPSGTDPGSYLL